MLQSAPPLAQWLEKRYNPDNRAHTKVDQNFVIFFFFSFLFFFCFLTTNLMQGKIAIRLEHERKTKDFNRKKSRSITIGENKRERIEKRTKG